MQNQVAVINVIAARERKEREEKRQAVVARINRQARERKARAQAQDEQARIEVQANLKSEIKRRFMLQPWASEADFNEAWKRDKFTMMREYEHAQRTAYRM